MGKTIFTVRSQVIHDMFKYSEQLSITFSSKEKIKNRLKVGVFDFVFKVCMEFPVTYLL